MSSFFNKVFGDSGDGDKKPESHLPKPNEGGGDSPFNTAPSNPNADMGHQLFGQLVDAESTKSSEPVIPLSPANNQGFVRPDKLPVRGFTAGELASLLPPEFINHQSMPAGQEVDLDLTRARQSMASGRPAVMLSDIYAACPRLFARPITADQDFEVRLPLKRVEALLGTTGGGHAGGPLSPFQMSADTSHHTPVPRAAPSERSPFSQAGQSQAPPASPFEVVGPSAPEPVSPQQSSVPLFSQPAPTPSEPVPTPMSQPAPAETFPNQSPQQYVSGESFKLQLGKALRFVGVDVLGFSAENVPESVSSEIPLDAIKRRNPNGSATVPLSVLVNGLEPVYRSAFNQADMFAHVTVPSDALPAASMMDTAPKLETAPVSPISTAHRTIPSVSVESPFAAFAREDAKKYEATAKQSLPTEESNASKEMQSTDNTAAVPAHPGVSEDTRALRDLSQRLSAFREQTHEAPEPDDRAAAAPVSAEQVKPLAPLSGMPAASIPYPQPKFRDLQDENVVKGSGEEPFIKSMAATFATPDYDPAPAPAPAPSAESADAYLDDDDDWKQVELKAVFGLEKTLDTKSVFDLINQLDDVRSAAFIQGQETKFATNGFGEAAPVLGGLIDKVRQLSNEIGIQGAQSFALQTNRGAVAFFSEGNCTIAVMAKGGDVSRASKQRIIVILRELARGC